MNTATIRKHGPREAEHRENISQLFSLSCPSEILQRSSTGQTQLKTEGQGSQDDEVSENFAFWFQRAKDLKMYLVAVRVRK